MIKLKSLIPEIQIISNIQFKDINELETFLIKNKNDILEYISKSPEVEKLFREDFDSNEMSNCFNQWKNDNFQKSNSDLELLASGYSDGEMWEILINFNIKEKYEDSIRIVYQSKVFYIAII